MINISEEFPPNIEAIRARFNLDGTKPLFTYGDTIYNPHKAELRRDLLIHEEVHVRQQGDTPDEWWNKYLEDDEFRLSQELDAYAVQFDYVKHLGVSAKKLDWFLERLAEILSAPIYGNLLTFNKAKTAIRKRQQEIECGKV